MISDNGNGKTISLPISIRAIRKTYGSFAALDSISLDIASGEFITLLGPSGSGKTTLLMVLAGFIRPDSGEIKFGDRDVSLVAAAQARRRDGVPELCALSAYDGGGQRRLSIEVAKDRQGGNSEARRQDPRARAAGRIWRPPHRSAVRRPTPARGARARDRLRAAHPADGRAAVGTRQEAARTDADRDPTSASAPRHDDGLRHARSARGAHHVGPCRCHRSRALPSDRATSRYLRAAGEQVHRRIHRRVPASCPFRCAMAPRISATARCGWRPGSPPRQQSSFSSCVRKNCGCSGPRKRLATMSSTVPSRKSSTRAKARCCT